MKTLNDQFCTEVFPFTGQKTEQRESGLYQATNLEGLHPLKVLMDGPDGSGVLAGDLILVSAAGCKSPYGQKRIRLLDGRVAIFVPKGVVYAVISAPEAARMTPEALGVRPEKEPAPPQPAPAPTPRPPVGSARSVK